MPFDVLPHGVAVSEPNHRTIDIVSWHQDLHYWGLETDEEVTAWVALSPATKESSCMRSFSGSQNMRVDHRDMFSDDNLLSRDQKIAIEVDENEAELFPGQMCIHHGRVFHTSHSNCSDDRRIEIAIHFIPTRARRATSSNMSEMLMRGEDRNQNFRPCCPPSGLMANTDIEHWSDIAVAHNAVLMES